MYKGVYWDSENVIQSCKTNFFVAKSTKTFRTSIATTAAGLEMEHDHFLSTHLLLTHLQSKSVAISLLRYPNFCYQTHLLSSQLWSHSFAIKPHLLSSLNCFRHICYQASLAIRPICYQSSVAINNFAINHNLLSNFRLALDLYFYQFFSKNPLKMDKFLKILKSSFSGKLCVGMEPAHFVQIFWKIAITTCIFTLKT